MYHNHTLLLKGPHKCFVNVVQGEENRKSTCTIKWNSFSHRSCNRHKIRVAKKILCQRSFSTGNHESHFKTCAYPQCVHEPMRNNPKRKAFLIDFRNLRVQRPKWLIKCIASVKIRWCSNIRTLFMVSDYIVVKLTIHHLKLLWTPDLTNLSDAVQ